VNGNTKKLAATMFTSFCNYYSWLYL